MSTDTLIHVPNLMLLISLAVRDVMLLRALNLLASIFFIAYFAILPEPLISAILWNALFGVMNVSRIWRIIVDRRPPALSIVEQRLHRASFSEMSLQDFKRVVDLGTSHIHEDKAVLAKAGQCPTSLWVVSRVEAEQGGTQNVSALAVGDMFGELAFFTEEPLPTDLVVRSRCEVIELPVVQLRKLMIDEVKLGISFQRILGRRLLGLNAENSITSSTFLKS